MKAVVKSFSLASFKRMFANSVGLDQILLHLHGVYTVLINLIHFCENAKNINKPDILFK